MPLDDRNKINRLEELKNRLSSKSFQTKIEHRDNFSRFSHQNVLDSWQMQEKAESGVRREFFLKTSVFKKFFLASVTFFVLALAYAAFVFFIGGNTVSNSNIDVAVSGNNFAAGGEELPLVIGITNRNSSALEFVDLVIEYPKGTADDLSSDAEHFRRSLGTIAAGESRNENVKLVLFGEQGSVRPIKISLEYRLEGSNAIFVKEKDYEVTISSTPINLSVDGPLSVSPEQDISLSIKETLNATKPASSILLKIDYPTGFTFTKAIPAPSFGNNVWNLGDLAPGAEKNILLFGKMTGVFDGEEKTFNISSGSQSAASKSVIGVVFNSTRHTLAVKKPFIEASLVVNGAQQKEYAVDWKTPLNVEIRFANNLETKVDNMQIEAKISGNAFNRKTIIAQQGFYDSAKDTIVWDASSQNQLKEVNPGNSGSVFFSMSPLSPFSSSGSILPDPSINIEINLSGQQSTEDANNTSVLENYASATVKITADISFSSKALYYSGPITNRGPIPPKVEQATTYTIVWSIANTTNDISGAQVNATLPAWVSFTNVVWPVGENISYNPSTRAVIWDIGKIPKGAGLSGAKKEAAFQISLSPSLSQVKTQPILLNGAVLTGHDDFANVDLRSSKGSLTTRLENDSALPPGGDIVVE